MALSETQVAHIKAMRERTGNVTSKDIFVGLVYNLLRDHIQPGELEKLVQDTLDHADQELHFTNGHLANYAKDIVWRLRSSKEKNLIWEGWWNSYKRSHPAEEHESMRQRVWDDFEQWWKDEANA